MREYLATRLHEAGCDTIFGVSGDYSTEFLESLGDNSKGVNIGKLIDSSNEQEAAYAAEGYAKATGGLGAVNATYRSGTFASLNGIASAFVERVPVIMINGAPKDCNFAEFATDNIMFHHMPINSYLAM